jgi:release factor glutamine methyltransferase
VTPPAGRTVGDLLELATARLRAARLPDPRREAIAILAIALATDRGGVFARRSDPIGPAAATRFNDLLQARESRVPLQHLEGIAEFRGLDFEVSADVLIPRPETEDLVQAVLDSGLPQAASVIDLGTGSGAIAIALALERPSWRLVAVDLSAEALAVAARNVARHGVGDRVELRTRDFAFVPAREEGAFEAVVSNPPYVPEAEWRSLQAEVRDHEPKLALVPGPSGNEAYAAVARAAEAMLRPGGLLALELGWRSEAAVRAIVAEAGFGDIEVRPDLQGIPRVLTARRRPSIA